LNPPVQRGKVPAMRLFVAIELPLPVRNHLARLRDRLQPELGHASFTRTENLHLTLKFLGEVDDQGLALLTESLRGVRADSDFELFAEEIECFPPRGRVRIVAARFGGELGPLSALQTAIEVQCEHLGYPPDTREYRPHSTLVRGRPSIPGPTVNRAAKLVESQLPGPVFQVREFVLMESRLLPHGAEYVALGRFQLNI
jgi:2'-5' RNA ligase